MPIEPNREETLFAAALRLSPAERAAFLDRESGGDAQLRQRVESLLQADAQAGEFLEEPPTAVSPETVVVTCGMVRVTEQPGERIGRYKLLEKIGEGGCGVTPREGSRRSSVFGQFPSWEGLGVDRGPNARPKWPRGVPCAKPL